MKKLSATVVLMADSREELEKIVNEFDKFMRTFPHENDVYSDLEDNIFGDRVWEDEEEEE